MRERGPLKTYTATLKEAIALKCGDCCAFDGAMILDCDSTDCPLVNFRPESRPDGLKKKYWSEKLGQMKALPVPRKRTMTEEQRRLAAQRLNAARGTRVGVS